MTYVPKRGDRVSIPRLGVTGTVIGLAPDGYYDVAYDDNRLAVDPFYPNGSKGGFHAASLIPLDTPKEF